MASCCPSLWRAWRRRRSPTHFSQKKVRISSLFLKLHYKFPNGQQQWLALRLAVADQGPPGGLCGVSPGHPAPLGNSLQRPRPRQGRHRLHIHPGGVTFDFLPNQLTDKLQTMLTQQTGVGPALIPHYRQLLSPLRPFRLGSLFCPENSRRFIHLLCCSLTLTPPDPPRLPKPPHQFPGAARCGCETGGLRGSLWWSWGRWWRRRWRRWRRRAGAMPPSTSNTSSRPLRGPCEHGEGVVFGPNGINGLGFYCEQANLYDLPFTWYALLVCCSREIVIK